MNARTLRPEDLDYDLPSGLIATCPAEPRDTARMLVMSRTSDGIEHRHVRDLPAYLAAADLLVMNDTCVAPARVIGRREGSCGQVEGLFLDELAEGRWRVMLKSNGRLREGTRIELVDAEGEAGGGVLELLERDGAEWIVRVEPARPALAVLEAVGRTPLPPYIIRARGEQVGDDLLDRAWYQTVYADEARRESVAAPTAGLHFTPDLLATLDGRGIRRAMVTLHVGAGTFKPITAPTLDAHEMHRERFETPAATIDAIRDLQRRRASEVASGRLIAVGTTTVRALESLPHPLPDSFTGSTDLLIAPSHELRLVEGLLTNFHLPRSTLLALVGALTGLDRLKAAYAEAIARRYRFYSYGDAMLILP